MKTCTYCGQQYLDEATVCATDGYPLQSPAAPPAAPSAREKHSGMGIASFALSILVGFLMLVVFVVAGMMSAQHTARGQNYPGQMLVGFLAIFLMGVDVVALALGIAAICQKDRKRVFGVLGLVFSAAIVLGTVGLIILGLMVSGRSLH